MKPRQSKPALLKSTRVSANCAVSSTFDHRRLRTPPPVPRPSSFNVSLTSALETCHAGSNPTASADPKLSNTTKAYRSASGPTSTK
jgi:hypothetical protein